MKWMFVGMIRFCLNLVLILVLCDGYDWAGLKLPDQHIPYFFRNNPEIKDLCQQDELCPYKDILDVSRCWGYERDCRVEERMLTPVCPHNSRGWTQSKEKQLESFWKGADFGYVKERLSEMKVICRPEKEGDSLLECAKYTRHCRAKHIFMDFTKSNINQPGSQFREDVFKEGAGEIGGYCRMDKAALRAEGEHKSALQSWYAELEHYSSLDFHPSSSESCDIIVEKPVFFMKLDAGINMFHHFCDFINLYASQHMNNSFSLDVYIVMWDTGVHVYRDFFSDTWKAFTQHPIINLRSYNGKKVCFQDAVFSLLPRMRYGMFYNMPLMPGCEDSSLFHAFNQQLIHRLNIPQEGPEEHKIRITLLSRNTTYRNILNENELLAAMKTVGEYSVQNVVYNLKMPFLDQVKVSHNSDIFIGMHGAGLTHMLFQPDWAVVMELYSCEDPNCYADLARLRGIKYMTWEKAEKLHQQDKGHHPTLGEHAKFTNYAFDLVEFMRLVAKAADHVHSHPAFIAARERKTKNPLTSDLPLKEEL